MDYIKYTSTYKADGSEYEKIVIWNRYLRNKTELILSLLPAIISIFLFVAGDSYFHTSVFRGTFAIVIYVVCVCYPFISFSQCKSAIRYHLAHRDAMEHAACDITLTELGILVEFHDSEEKKSFHWADFTTIYDHLGYFMCFHKGDMLVMLRQADMEDKKAVKSFIHDHIDRNNCLLK
ncbi:MAG: hypothetical protein K6C69_00580 [Lachnospiraceae bacterium]|nr:hypothetical protein [Lachnospiraceae bacterium]